jgi:predicted O-methyltransferase YrrM
MILQLIALIAPYNDLKEVLPFNPKGMYINQIPIEQLIKKKKPKIVVELGCWLGQSTRHIASLLPEDGKVYAVDHWLGSEEHQHSLELSTLYEQFLSNVIHTNLTDKIIPFRMTTLQAADEFYRMNLKPDLVYIDAAHDEESVYADLTAYFPLVEGHGVLCGDDWNWGDGSVKKAVIKFARENRLKIELHNDWFWILCES